MTKLKMFRVYLHEPLTSNLQLKQLRLLLQTMMKDSMTMLMQKKGKLKEFILEKLLLRLNLLRDKEVKLSVLPNKMILICLQQEILYSEE